MRRRRFTSQGEPAKRESAEDFWNRKTTLVRDFERGDDVVCTVVADADKPCEPATRAS